LEIGSGMVFSLSSQQNTTSSRPVIISIVRSLFARRIGYVFYRSLC
jgi:hypothetical protein